MPAYAVTNPAGTKIATAQRDQDGMPCGYFLLMPDGTTIAANSRTGLIMELVSGYRQLVEMAEIVEAGGEDGIAELFGSDEYAAAAEALIDGDEEDDPEQVVEVLDAVMFEYRRQYLAQAANDMQMLVVLSIQREQEALGVGLEDLDADFMAVMLFDRSEAALDFGGEEWTHRWPLFLVTSAYAPFDPDGPKGPTGERVVWLDPSNETTFLESIAQLGLGELLLLDDDVELELEESA